MEAKVSIMEEMEVKVSTMEKMEAKVSTMEEMEVKVSIMEEMTGLTLGEMVGQVQLFLKMHKTLVK